MNLLLLIPVVISSLLLSAHFLRSGSSVLCGLSLGMLVLLLVRRRWAAIVVQIFLLLGALEWLRTLVNFVEVRQTMGLPWMRLMIILAGVLVWTATAALLFETPGLRRRYGAVGG